MRQVMQHLLRIRLPPGQLLYASRFRELLAKTQALPNAFFNLHDTGSTICSLPSIRVVGGRGWVGILAGDDGRDLLYQAVGPAISSVSSELGVPCSMNIEQLEVSAELTDYPVEYWAREVVIRRRRQWVTDQPIEYVLRRTILRGLATYANQYGIDLPSDEQLDLDNLEIRKHQYLNIQTKDGVAVGEHAILVDAHFTMFANLKGHWVVGSLQSRGYGRIGFDLSQLAVNLHREDARPRPFIQ